MHSKLSEAFIKPISSNMPNANNQIFQNSKDEVSFLHFLKIGLVGILWKYWPTSSYVTFKTVQQKQTKNTNKLHKTRIFQL